MLTPSVNIVQSAFPEKLQGEISGLSRSVSNLGSSLGTAIAGTILVAGLADPKRSYGIAMIVLAFIGLIGTNALDADVWSAIHVSLVRRGHQIVAVIHCPARAGETWHHDDAGELFYMRASNTTPWLTGSSLVRYIRERWPV